ncbi:hypothetical protein TrRE_jg5557 [Triparma retinervis]|uniref:ENTH domain-containing protein n=1 Tax=Triparma retinervis TaxID=2557542 RepID=A0A9W6ZCQ8_9STRA|nr:hypothetical protein TrRE_jg5557 [Triparma retinervis]
MDRSRQASRQARGTTRYGNNSPDLNNSPNPRKRTSFTYDDQSEEDDVEDDEDDYYYQQQTKGRGKQGNNSNRGKKQRGQPPPRGRRGAPQRGRGAPNRARRGSSGSQVVLLKATRPDDTGVKPKHVERLVGVTYQISGQYDLYDPILRKLWAKMAELDYRTNLKALYVLHRFSSDGSPDHAPALKARLRELRRTRDQKRKEKYFNSRMLLATSAGDAPEAAPYKAFMARYAHYVLLRTQCFGGAFTEISTPPPSRGGRDARSITSTSLREEHLEAARMILKSGTACAMKDGEDCEVTGVCLERVAADLRAMTKAVEGALTRALKPGRVGRGQGETDKEIVRKWCEFYGEELLPRTRAMVKEAGGVLEGHGIYLDRRVGGGLKEELLRKGMRGEEEVAEEAEEGGRKAELKELAKLRKQHILSEDEFVDLKKNILYGDGGGFGAGGGGVDREMGGEKRIPGPGEFFVKRGHPGERRPGTVGGGSWGRGGFPVGQQMVVHMGGGMEMEGTYERAYVPPYGEGPPYYQAEGYQLPQQGGFQQHNAHSYRGQQHQQQHPMEKPWVRRLAEKRGRKPKTSPISSPSVKNGGETDDTASTSSASSSDGGCTVDETGMATIRKKLNPTVMQLLPPANAMMMMGRAEQQREDRMDLQRRLEEHQARLAAGKARSKIPHLSRPPRPILASRSEPNSARRSASAHIRRSLGKSDFAITKLPSEMPKGSEQKEGGRVMVSANTGRIFGPPYSSRGGMAIGINQNV